MLNIIKKKFGNLCSNGKRIYIEDPILNKAGFNIGLSYSTKICCPNNEVIFYINENGNKISKKVKKTVEIPVIDKTGKEIEEAFNNCSSMLISIYFNKIVIKGIKNTKESIEELGNIQHKLSCVTFCAGAGITSYFNKKVGFREVAAVEYNPKTGKNSKFSDIYEVNNPEVLMLNIPIENVKGKDIPKSDLWVATLDCTDFSKLASTKKEYQTMHLFVHLLRIFYEKKKEDRPNSILIENVPEFEKIAGNVLKLCFQEEGYEVNMKKLNSLEFGSRTKRERLFLFASIFHGFKFPEKTGEIKTPILQDGKITLESLNFKSPFENKTLNYYIKRDCKTHNHKFKTIDITKDSYFETIVKQHSKGKASNWIKHPTEEKYAYIEREEHLKYLHDIPEEYYLGTSVNSFSEAIGQSVCGKTYSLIIETVYRFISNCFGAEKQLKFEF